MHIDVKMFTTYGGASKSGDEVQTHVNYYILSVVFYSVLIKI